MNRVGRRTLAGCFVAACLCACGGASNHASAVAITVSPASASIGTAAQAQLTATVTGSSDTAVIWSVQESAGGTVSGAGLYTAPAAAGVFHVVATADADASKTASAEITVTVPAPSSNTIGPEGGTVSLAGGPSLLIPAGALGSATVIGIEVVTQPSPAGGALYHFTPGGTVFSQPITVTFPVPAGQTTGSIYWTQSGSSAAYDVLPTTITAAGAQARTNHFSFGFFGAVCVQGAACSADACHAGATDCSSGVAVCAAGDALPDGSSCGTGQVCSSGSCVASGTRTVSGTFSTVWQKDDGSQTAVAGFGPNAGALKALLFSNGAGGYSSVNVTAASDGTFSVPNVPNGTYYLRIEQITFPINVTDQQAQSVLVSLIPLTSSTPDLSSVLHGRPDAVAPAETTSVTLNVTGLAPFSNQGPVTDSLFLTTPAVTGSESVFSEPAHRPPLGATSAAITFDWRNDAFEGLGRLPDASKGDVTWFYNRTFTPLANGGKAAVSTRFAKSTAFSVVDGGSNTFSIDLQAAPLSSTAPTAGQLSAFAALVPGMNPAALLTPDPGPLTFPGAGAGFFAIPGSLSFPDFPSFNVVGRVALYDYVDLATDTDYGPLSYGGFFDSSFQTMRNFVYSAGVVLTADGGSVGFEPSFTAQEPAGSLASVIAPVIGPVRAPLINGHDAFTAQTGVGLTPTLSWSAPSLGSASSYGVVIQMLSVPDDASAVGMIAVSVNGALSFTVPSGLLQKGKTYAATITASDAPSADENRPFRAGLPFYSADAVTNTFTP